MLKKRNPLSVSFSIPRGLRFSFYALALAAILKRYAIIIRSAADTFCASKPLSCGRKTHGNRPSCNLIKNLPDEAFKYTKQEFKKEQFNLMKQKGIYPYDHMDSFDRFNETKLPVQQDFYSILNNEHISDKQYKHAQNVWDTFNLKTMGDYHDLYLKSDILLLADVFENFRKTCLQYYKLDPCHYFTSPGLSWDAMLKMTNIKL